MIKIILFILFLGYSITGIYAQEITHTVVPIGKNYTTGKIVEGQKIVFPQEVYRFEIDSVTEYWSLQLRSLRKSGEGYAVKGELLSYQPFKKQVIWNNQISYKGERLFYNFPYILHPNGSTTVCYNGQDGGMIWEVKGRVVGIYNSVGLLARGDGAGKRIAGIDLATGKRIWSRKVNVSTGVDVYGLNDSVLVVRGMGLHQINLRTGQGWDYKANTGEGDIGRGIAWGGSIFTLGIFATIAIMSDDEKYIKNVASGLLFEDDDIYWAGKDRIVRLKKDGKVVWEKPLPQSSVSRSSLILQDSLLYMLNYGETEKGKETTSYGNPFVAAYNKDDGRQLFCNVVFDKDEKMKDYSLSGASVWIANTNKLIKYTMQDGLPAEKVYKRTSSENFDAFVEKGVYRKRADDLFYDWVQAIPQYKIVRTDSLKYLVFDGDVNLIKTEDGKAMYTEYRNWKGYRFLYGQGQTYIIDKENKPVAILNVSPQSVLVKNRLYEKYKNLVITVDLNQLGLN